MKPVIDSVPVMLSTVNLPPLDICPLGPGPDQVTVGVGLPLILLNKDTVPEPPD